MARRRPARGVPGVVVAIVVATVVALALVVTVVAVRARAGGSSSPSPSSGASSGQTASSVAGSSSGPASGSSAGPAATVRLAAAGDIACDPGSADFNAGNGTKGTCQQRATSDLILTLHPDAVLTLGDDQYENGTADAFARSYDPSWGRFKAITHPAPGNHELDPLGYYGYFGAAAGTAGKGWYSYDLGAWHLVVLNSDCDVVNCEKGSEQEEWLRADLAAHPVACTLAYWHHPRWSHGEHGDNTWSAPFVEDLYAAGADVILNGHDHDYERLVPLDPSGAVDEKRGLQEFVVGSGGRSHYVVSPVATTRAYDDKDFGVLSMTLSPTGYSWRFVLVGGSTSGDAGTGTCH